jgi:crossover junction endodeoxyribonuclease RuvC
VTRVLALDLSLTSTGYATPDGEVGTLKPGERRGPERLSWVRDEILALEHHQEAELVAIEGYSYGSKGRATFSIAELGGVVRCALYNAGIAYLEVSPAVVKKYATGKGNAPKDLVLVEAVRRLGYAGSSTDEADALWIRALTLDLAGAPVVEVPKTHRAALDKLDAPTLEATA